MWLDKLKKETSLVEFCIYFTKLYNKISQLQSFYASVYFCFAGLVVCHFPSVRLPACLSPFYKDALLVSSVFI
jgi:hypothetical protein